MDAEIHIQGHSYVPEPAPIPANDAMVQAHAHQLRGIVALFIGTWSIMLGTQWWQTDLLMRENHRMLLAAYDKLRENAAIIEANAIIIRNNGKMIVENRVLGERIADKLGVKYDDILMTVPMPEFAVTKKPPDDDTGYEEP